MFSQMKSVIFLTDVLIAMFLLVTKHISRSGKGFSNSIGKTLPDTYFYMTDFQVR